MKILLTLILLPLMIISISAEGKIKNKEVLVTDNTISSLIEGIESDNIGLKTSAAFMLGELKVTEAVIPLMRLIHNDDCEEVRISAALALYKIGTPLSINCIKQAIRFDGSERVSKIAQTFYNEYLRIKYSAEEDTTESLALIK